jgi:hypothetical protein
MNPRRGNGEREGEKRAKASQEAVVVTGLPGARLREAETASVTRKAVTKKARKRVEGRKSLGPGNIKRRATKNASGDGPVGAQFGGVTVVKAAAVRSKPRKRAGSPVALQDAIRFGGNTGKE